jgi:hypothetical protein
VNATPPELLNHHMLTVIFVIINHRINRAKFKNLQATAEGAERKSTNAGSGLLKLYPRHPRSIFVTFRRG